MLTTLTQLKRRLLLSRLLLFAALEVTGFALVLSVLIPFNWNTLCLLFPHPLDVCLIVVFLALTLLPVLLFFTLLFLKPVTPQNLLTELLRRNPSKKADRLCPAALDFELHRNHNDHHGSSDLHQLVSEEAIRLLKEMNPSQLVNRKQDAFSASLLIFFLPLLIILPFLTPSAPPVQSVQSVRPEQAKPSKQTELSVPKPEPQAEPAPSCPVSQSLLQQLGLPETGRNRQKMESLIQLQQHLLAKTTQEWIETSGQSVFQLSPEKRHLHARLAQLQEMIRLQLFPPMFPNEAKLENIPPLTESIEAHLERSSEALKNNRLGESMQIQQRIVLLWGGRPDDELPEWTFDLSADSANDPLMLAFDFGLDSGWEDNTNSVERNGQAGTGGTESAPSASVADMTGLTDNEHATFSGSMGSTGGHWGELPQSDRKAVPLIPQESVIPKYREQTERYFKRLQTN